MPRKVDSNHAEIVAGLRQFGASVQDLHEVGHGCPDILVGYNEKSYPMEIKSDCGHLTKDEWSWFEHWKGNAYIVHTIEEAIKIITEG